MKVYSLLTFFSIVFLSACGTVQVSIEQGIPTASHPIYKADPIVGTPTPLAVTGRAVIAYTKEGDAFVWDEATGQTKTIFASGDVTRLAMSDDGQVIALVRHIEAGTALWAVDWNGRNPRELVSTETLRQRLERVQSEAEILGAGIGELEWIPGSHRLIYNWTFQIGSGGYLASPDVYLLDADLPSDTLIARDVPIDPVKQMNIVPSPDGQQVAIITSTSLSLLNVDGSNRRNSIFTYPSIGASSPPILMSTGVWTQDSSAFLVTGSLEMDAEFNFGFSIWLVPVDASSPRALTPILKGRPDSVRFSPDGKFVAFLQNTEGSLIAPLTEEIGPLAVAYKLEPESAENLHWSPSGDAFTKDLLRLCSNASRESDVCETPFNTHVSGVLGVQWLDGQRALFLTNAPSILFLSSLNNPPVLIDFSGSFDGVLVEQG
jgi:Tol biopolymer transport system component